MYWGRGPNAAENLYRQSAGRPDLGYHYKYKIEEAFRTPYEIID